MKLFLMFIPLILVYSQVFVPNKENIINGQLTKIPIYYLNLKNIYNQMIDSCVSNANNVNQVIKNDCKNKILIFLNKVSNNTIDFSTSIEEIYRDILKIIIKYPNLEMIKKNIIQYLYKRFTNNVRIACSPLNTRRLEDNSDCSTFLGNTLCRLIHFFWGDDAWDCD